MDNLKKCPYCGEMIQQSAKKCRYCGEWLPEEQEKGKNPTSSYLQEKISSLQSLVDSNKPASVSTTQSAMPKLVFPSLHNVVSFAKCSKFFEVTTIIFIITAVLTLGANILAAEYGNLTLKDAWWCLQYCEFFSQMWFGGLFTFLGPLLDDIVWDIAMVIFLLQIKKYNQSLPTENQIGNLWLWLAVITTCVTSIHYFVNEEEGKVTLFISILFIVSFLLISWQIFKRWRSTRKDYLLGVCLGLMMLVSIVLALFSSVLPVAIDNFLQSMVSLIGWVWLYFHIAHDYILDYQQDSLAGVQLIADEQLASMRIFRHDVFGLNPVFQKVMGRYNQREEIQSIVDKMKNDIKFSQSISVPMSAPVTIPNAPQPTSTPAVSSMGESPATNEPSNASLNEQTSYLSFGKAISACFRKYAKFSGRASRSEFWWWVLFVNLLPLPFLLMYFIPNFIYMQDGYSYFDAMMMHSYTIENNVSFNVVLWLSMLMLLITFLPSLAVTVRRLHDVGGSGWYLLSLLIPILGPLYLLFGLTARSKDVSSCTSQDSSQEKPTEL